MSDEEDNTVMGSLKKIVSIEGHEEGTDSFDRRLRQLQVSKCREIRGVFTCNECKFFDYCELVRKVMRDKAGYKE